MSYISAVLCQSFLKNFNYCDNKGHRNSSIFRKLVSPLFDNAEMTKELEQIARVVVNKISEINALPPEERKANEDKYVAGIFEAMNGAIDGISRARKKYSKGPGFIECELQKVLEHMKVEYTNCVLSDTIKVDNDNLPFYRKTYASICNALTRLNSQSLINHTENKDLATGYLSAVLCQSFLRNFNYCNSRGQRNSSRLRKFTSPIFDNTAMTKKLEEVALKLIRSIKEIADLALEKHPENEAKHIETLFERVKSATDAIFTIRKTYHTVYTVTTAPAWASPTIQYIPKSPGFIEKEIRKTLEKMKLDYAEAVLGNNSDVTDLSVARGYYGMMTDALLYLKVNRPKMTILSGSDMENSGYYI